MHQNYNLLVLLFVFFECEWAVVFSLKVPFIPQFCLAFFLCLEEQNYNHFLCFYGLVFITVELLPPRVLNRSGFNFLFVLTAVQEINTSFLLFWQKPCQTYYFVFTHSLFWVSCSGVRAICPSFLYNHFFIWWFLSMIRPKATAKILMPPSNLTCPSTVSWYQMITTTRVLIHPHKS